MGVLLSFGHGYSAQALSRNLVAKDWLIYGTTRREDGFYRVAKSGAEPMLWPSDPVLNTLADKIVARREQFKWVGYLSTTGVYGDHNGGWVTEETPLTPSTERGQMRVQAEAAWAELGLPLHIFRLAGIYGPGRGPFAKVQKGTARRIIKKNQLFSRIHVEDIAQILAASIATPNPGSIYNVCDDLAAPPEDVIGYAAELLGIPIPADEAFETAEMTQMARSFYSESKKVSNQKLKHDLGVVLKYPDYRVGLQALLKDME